MDGEGSDDFDWSDESFQQMLQEAERNAVVDIEDAQSSSPFERHRQQKGFLSVSDLVGMEWCGLQFHYTLEGPGYRTATPAMRKGRAIHHALELEVHDIVKVETTAKEDVWGLRLFNCLQGLKEMLRGGKTRELAVFGFTHDTARSSISSFPSKDRYVIYGIIDEIERHDDPSNNISWHLSDTKTRARPQMPKSSKTEASKFQLMLYKHLFDALTRGPSAFDADAFFNALHLDPDVPFSDAFLAQTCTNDNSSPMNLRILLQDTLVFFALFPSLSPSLTLSYRSQQTLALLGEIVFEYDEQAILSHLQKALGYWGGDRMSEVVRGVEMDEAFKCGICEFADVCEWRRKKCEELVKGGGETKKETIRDLKDV
ncbi:exonuclease V [Endogone sp. FLAS-F59071]|nr:exonuclease V [Endogone sp. FLAS-F59071]|eukprot:RUS14459.1 exonuclease V [Endogone sp. FLAS-F59071]